MYQNTAKLLIPPGKCNMMKNGLYMTTDCILHREWMKMKPENISPNIIQLKWTLFGIIYCQTLQHGNSVIKSKS